MNFKKCLLCAVVGFGLVGLVGCSGLSSIPSNVEIEEDTRQIENVEEVLESDTLIYEIELYYQRHDYYSEEENMHYVTPIEKTLQGYISPERYFYKEIESGKIVDYTNVWSNEDGYVSSSKLDLQTNEVITTTEDTLFSSTYFNPFNLIDLDDGEDETFRFRFESDDLDSETCDALLYLFTGKELSGYDFDFIIEYDEITKEVTGASLEFSKGEFNDAGVGYLKFVDEDHINLPPLASKREATSETDTLQEAFETLTYTADGIYAEVKFSNDEDETTEYEIYYDVVTDNLLVYEDETTGFGATNVEDDAVKFDYFNGYLIATDTYENSTVNDLTPSYDLLAYMFDLQEDGTYKFALDYQESDLVDLLLFESFALENIYPDPGTFVVSVNKADNKITGITYTYKYATTYTVEVSLSIMEVGLIFDYPPIEDTTLHRTMVKGFNDKEHLNYNEMIGNGYRIYPIDQETYEIIGEPIEDSSWVITTKSVDNDVIVVENSGASYALYSVNTDTGYTSYKYDLSTGEGSFYSSYEGKWQDTYSIATDLLLYLSYFEVENDGYSVCDEYDVVNNLSIAAGRGYIENPDTYNTDEFTFVPSASFELIDSISINLEIAYKGELRYADESNNTLVYYEQYMFNTIYNINCIGIPMDRLEDIE